MIPDVLCSVIFLKHMPKSKKKKQKNMYELFWLRIYNLEVDFIWTGMRCNKSMDLHISILISGIKKSKPNCNQPQSDIFHRDYLEPSKVSFDRNGYFFF